MPIIDSLLSVIAPHECVGCGAEGVVLCATCVAALPAKQPSCPHCSQSNKTGLTCARCRPQSALDGVLVAKEYDGIVTKLVWDLKYESKVAAAEAMAGLITPLLSPTNYDVITAVAGSPSRYRRRSYHQAEPIAKHLSRQTGVPYQPLLGRWEVASQVGSSRAERLARVKDSFWLRHENKVEGKRVLVIDDVLTTGATMGEAARVLRDAGAVSVWGAAVAKH